MYGYPTGEDEQRPDEEGDVLAQSVKVNKRNFVITILLMLVLFTVPLFFKTTGGTDLFDWSAEQMTLTFPDGTVYTVPYADVTYIELLENFRAGTVVSGETGKSISYGLRSDETLGEYVLCCSGVFDTVIRLDTADKIYVISYESANTTRELYSSLRELTGETS